MHTFSNWNVMLWSLNVSFFILLYLCYYVLICERFGNWSDVIYGFMQYVLKLPYIDKWEEFMYKSHTVFLVLMVVWWKIATQVKCKWIWRFAFLTLSPDSCIRFLRLGWTIFRWFHVKCSMLGFSFFLFFSRSQVIVFVLKTSSFEWLCFH